MSDVKYFSLVISWKFVTLSSLLSASTRVNLYFIPFQLISILVPESRPLYFIVFFRALPLEIPSCELFDRSVVSGLRVYLCSDPDLFSKCSLSSRHRAGYREVHRHTQTHDGTTAVNRRFRKGALEGVQGLCWPFVPSDWQHGVWSQSAQVQILTPSLPGYMTWTSYFSWSEWPPSPQNGALRGINLICGLNEGIFINSLE